MGKGRVLRSPSRSGSMGCDTRIPLPLPLPLRLLQRRHALPPSNITCDSSVTPLTSPNPPGLPQFLLGHPTSTIGPTRIAQTPPQDLPRDPQDPRDHLGVPREGAVP